MTSSRGDTSTATKSVQVTRVNQRPTAAFSVSCQGMACSFDGGASGDPDGPVTLIWNFGDGTYGTGPNPTHVYASEGTRRVTLMVTDTDGVAASVAQDVTATLQRIDFVGAAAANANAGKHRVTVPADVKEGDLLVLHLALNTTCRSPTRPAGPRCRASTTVAWPLARGGGARRPPTPAARS